MELAEFVQQIFKASPPRTIQPESDRYVVFVGDHVWKEFSQMHWLAALRNAKRQLAGLRYWNKNG